MEKHKVLNGIEISIYIPYADNPNKEFHFIGEFLPDTLPLQPQKPSDNVKAMCDAHKLSSELEKHYCLEQPLDASPSLPSVQLTEASELYSSGDQQTAANLAKLSCAQIGTLILSNPQIGRYLPYTWKTAQSRCKQ